MPRIFKYQAMKYNSIVKKGNTVSNHEGARAYAMTPEMELYTAVVSSCLCDSFYESGNSRAGRIAQLVRKVDPVFVAKLAVYARTKMNLRSIPLLLIVELAGIHNGDSLVSDAIAGTVLRADEIMELLACYQWINSDGRGIKKLNRLSKQVQKGLSAAFNRFDEYQFAKYDRKGLGVTLRDALFLVHPKAEDDARQAIFDKIAARALETPYTWETQLSDLGQQSFASEEEKKAAIRQLWEELLDSGKLGYMALLRNLRNILKAEVSAEHVSALCGRLADKTEVVRSKQLPFRFLAAYKEILACRSAYSTAVLSALEEAADVSVANLDGFGLGANVLVASDVSGSMMSPVSPKSSIEYYDIGILLGMLLKSRCASVVSGMFGDTWKVLDLPQKSVLSNTVQMRMREGEVGYSTNGHKVIAWLAENGIRMDKVMIFTDCQMWDSSFSGQSLEKSWDRYKKICPEARLYLFDLAGYGAAPVRLPGRDVTLIAGWSDRVFDVLAAIEHGEDALSEINSIII